MRKTRILMSDVLTSREKHEMNRISRKNGRIVAGNLFSHLSILGSEKNWLIQTDERGYIRRVRYPVGEGFKFMKPFIQGNILYLVDDTCRIHICSYDLTKNLVL